MIEIDDYNNYNVSIEYFSGNEKFLDAKDIESDVLNVGHI